MGTKHPLPPIGGQGPADVRASLHRQVIGDVEVAGVSYSECVIADGQGSQHDPIPVRDIQVLFTGCIGPHGDRDAVRREIHGTLFLVLILLLLVIMGMNTGKRSACRYRRSERGASRTGDAEFTCSWPTVSPAELPTACSKDLLCPGRRCHRPCRDRAKCG